LALRTGASTAIAIDRTQAYLIAALQGLLKVFCSAPHCAALRVVDITTVENQWGQHNAWSAGHDGCQPHRCTDSGNLLQPLLSCHNLEYIALSIEDGEGVLPELLRRPKLRTVRLQGTYYGDISGDSELPDELCEAIAASRLRTLHLRYACWTGKQLVLPSTLRELVVESYPWDENFGAPYFNEEEVPGDVVVGAAQLQLLAFCMSCVRRDPVPPGPSRFPEKPHFYDRYGCWDGALLRSFRSCGLLQRVVLPRDATCVTDDGATALELALTTASQHEAFHSWVLLGLQLQRSNPCAQLQRASPADTSSLRFAMLPQTLIRRVLDFAVTGPKVERPNVWPQRDPETDHFDGFPTLAAHCSVAADLHTHNAFHVGKNDKVKDALLEQEWYSGSPVSLAPAASKRSKNAQKNAKRRVRRAQLAKQPVVDGAGSCRVRSACWSWLQHMMMISRIVQHDDLRNCTAR